MQVDPQSIAALVVRGGTQALRLGAEAIRVGGEVLADPRGRLDELVRSDEAAAITSSVDARISQFRENRRLGDSAFRGLAVVVHRGYVVVGDRSRAAEARLHLRVVEEPVIPEGAGLPYLDVLQANLRRYGALGLPGLRVDIEVGDGLGSGSVVTGRRGYAALSVPLVGLEQASPGWIPVLATVAAQRGEPATSGTGRVLLPNREAPFAVVSDIDDTIIRTGLAEGLAAMRRTLFRDAHSRQAIPGMASLYRGLSKSGRADAAVSGVSPVPFYYVSTGSWSFYDMLAQFLQLRGFPRGPLFLTDWGPTSGYITRSGVEHKRKAITRLLQASPHTSFVMVGDSGQHDTDVYVELAREFPEQARAIFILDLGLDEQRTTLLLGQAEQARSEGVPLWLVPNARQLALKAVELGLCAPEVVEDVEIELAARV